MSLKIPTDNRMLVGILAAGGIAILILIALTFGAGGASERVETLEVPCTIQPGWSDGSDSAEPAGSVAGAGEDSREIRVYLDTSHPMGGYLPPPGIKSEALFRALAQLVPGHLVPRYSGPVRWFGFDRTLHPLEQNVRITRALFRGGETRLDLALDDLIEAFESGRTQAAVLVTDLVSTAGPEGAMGAAEPLVRWNRSTAVRTGRYDLGLLAVRAEYWGVDSRRCSGPGPLGCWFSEHANRYLPLTDAAQRPLYFLFFGSAGSGGVDRLEEAGRSFQAVLDDAGLETRWELLSQRSEDRRGSLLCSAFRRNRTGTGREPQFALVRTGEGRHECRRDEPVVLSCCVAAGQGGAPSCEGAIPVQAARASWPQVDVTVEAGRLEALVDCAALRGGPPEAPLFFEDVRGNVPASGSRGWRDWSALSDEQEESLGGTLQMDLFVETVRLRSDHYRIELEEPVLRWGS